jgi:hypothetical protein
MANANRPFGLRPVRYLSGAAWNGAATTYYATGGTDIFIGDPVVLTGTAAAAGTTINGMNVEGMPAVTVAAAAATLLGVCVGVVPAQATDSVYYASGDRLIMVVDDPMVIFQIQEDGVGQSIQVAEIGNNADIATYAAGSTVTGNSAVTLDSSDVKTATAQLRILRLSDVGNTANNAISTGGAASNYAVFDVLINEHMFNQAAGI